MKRAVILSLIMVWVLAALGGARALADQNSSANRLVVESVGLLKQARNEADPERRFELITKVEANLDRVIDRYPGSDAAVKLATGQGIGILSLELVASEKAKYEALTIAGQAKIKKARCFAAPSRECLWAQALAMARNIADAERRVASLGKIAQSLAEAGDVGRTREIIEEALIAVKGMDGAYQRALVFAWMSYLQAEIGDFRQARKSIAAALLNIKKVEDSGNRAATFELLAQVQAKAGDAKLALETVHKALAAAKDFESESAKEFPNTNIATWVLSRMVGTQAKVGAVDEALAAARAMGAAYPRAWTLAKIAAVQIEAGDSRQAQETINEALAGTEWIPNTYERGQALIRIIQIQTEMGDVEQARLTIAKSLANVEAIKYAGYSAEILGRIAVAQAELGDMKQARQSIAEATAKTEQIKYDIDRATALLWIGKAQAKTGNRRLAHETMTAAVAKAKQISDADLRYRALFDVLEAQSEVGYVKEALATAKELRDDASRVSALLKIASNIPN